MKLHQKIFGEVFSLNMKFIYSLLLISFYSLAVLGQTKISGVILDKKNKPIPFANIVFKSSNEGTLANEDGRFYLESIKTYSALLVTFEGYVDREIPLTKAVNYDFKIILTEKEKLKEVIIYNGKTSKKNNPAIDILRKIWARRRQNGLKKFDQYEMDKYEKVEFDMNTIDSAFMKSKLFKGMEFVFKQVDTSKVTGKTYLPIFINESLSQVYGDNKAGKTKEILIANKNSGFNTNQQIIAFVKDLYSDYDIYDNYMNFFNKSFTSPLSRTGIDVYNYVLTDSTYIDKKWCYNIVFYPRRKNELTFKGDFWVNDSTWAIKKINMAVTKSANINWVKDIYIEQEFDVLNDSVFLLSKDYMMSDFALSKKEFSKGVYGKRTTFYKNHKFNIEKPKKFYKDDTNFIDNSVYTKSDDFWKENRFEKLSKDEAGVYKMLDTLQTVKRFRQIYDVVTILASGYIQKGFIDYGPVFSTIGYNEVEGARLRIGGRTYFGNSDTWRLQAYTAYGFKDNKFKYGFSGKWMIEKKNRIIISGGNRRDVEQIGASLTSTTDVLGRSVASSSVFTTRSNGKLTNINLSNAEIEIEPEKNLNFSTGFTYKTLESAAPRDFSLDYYSDESHSGIKSKVNQSEVYFQIDYTPNRKPIGYAVERSIVSSPYSQVFINYTQGLKGVLNSDFNYQKLQLYYKQPLIIGPLGTSNFITEMGKTYGTVPLSLMGVIPGNQSLFAIKNTFNNLNFYEFLSDQYVTLQWTHDFGGRFFSRIPLMRKLNWREIVGLKTVYGTVSDANRAINASGLVYVAPQNGYWEYSAGIGNIFKVFRIDFSWRGSYLYMPEATRFAVKGSFGFYF